MKKTNEEIQALKDNWRKEPNWEIEYTEGFEDHFEDLLAFRKEQEDEWQILAEENRKHRANVVSVETGITNPDIQQNVNTFREIEKEVDEGVRNAECIADLIAGSQVRATLLLAAQVARIADALEKRNEEDASNDAVDFATKLYKVE